MSKRRRPSWPAMASRRGPCTYFVGRCDPHPGVHAASTHGMTIEGASTSRKSGPFVLAPVHRSIRRHADRRGVTPPPDALHGQGLDVEATSRSAGSSRRSVASRSTRGTADREALKRCIAVLEGGEPLVLFPEGERKSGPLVQPAVRRRHVRRRQGRRADRAGRHRRLGAGHAEEAKFVYPRKVHLEVGQPIPSPQAAPGERPDGTSTRNTASGCTTSCSDCSTKRCGTSPGTTQPTRSTADRHLTAASTCPIASPCHSSSYARHVRNVVNVGSRRARVTNRSRR